MRMTPQTILFILQEVKRGKRHRAFGICYAAARLADGWNARASQVYQWLEDSFRAMGLSTTYPVAGGVARYNRASDMWADEYGVKRLALLDLLIERAESQCQEGRCAFVG